MYNILVQNNASREFFIYSGLTNVSANELYLEFDEIELQEGMNDGEYTYAVFPSNGEFGITPKTPILDTILTSSGESITLRYLNPLVGLLSVGKVEEMNVYDEAENTSYPYDGKNEENNNDLIYYEG